MILVDPSARYLLVGWCVMMPSARYGLEVRRLPWQGWRRLGLVHWRDDRPWRVRVVDGERVVLVQIPGRHRRPDGQVKQRRPIVPMAARRLLGERPWRLRVVYDLARGEFVLTPAWAPPPFGMVTLGGESRSRSHKYRKDGTPYPSTLAAQRSGGVR